MASCRYSFSLYLLLLATTFQLASSHPQCLDYFPPFKPQKPLWFCHEYSNFSCCNNDDDRRIQQKFLDVVSRADRESEECEKMLRDNLCLECHPYASHIFDAESNVHEFSKKTAVPGLCYGYCKQFVSRCWFLLFAWEKEIKIKNQGYDSPWRTNFCFHAQTTDVDYCYPDIMTTLSESQPKTNVSWKSDEGCLCVQELAQGFMNPLAVVHANDGSHRLFIAEQQGVVWVMFQNGTFHTKPFLNITEHVLFTSYTGDERGFLGIAFHPKFSQNGRVFVYYSRHLSRNKRKNKAEDDKKYFRQRHKIVISEYKISTWDPNELDPQSKRWILSVRQPAPNHNGGQILFGLDGYLYIFLGDGGRAGDPFGKVGNGQNRGTLLGSVLRIDVDTSDGARYKIPPDNPFLDDPRSKPEIFAYGTRNMWRCSVDRGDRLTGEGKGRIFCGDVGQGKFEEIDIIQKGGNYGWRAREGFKCYDRSLCKNKKMLKDEVLPIHAYNHTFGKSVLGGYVYRGCEFPNMRGKYFFADTWSGRMFSLTEDKEQKRWSHQEVCTGSSAYCTDRLQGFYEKYILSFGEDERGELYMVATPNPSAVDPGGKLYRLVDPSRRSDPSECRFTVKEPVIPEDILNQEP